MMCNAFSQAALSFTGQNYGAKNIGRVKKTYIYCATTSAAFAVVIGFLIITFGETLLSIYLPDSPKSVELGLSRLTIILSLYIFETLMHVTSQVISGMGHTLITTVITLIGVCGFRLLWIATIFQIDKFHSPQSIYLSYPITWCISFVVQAIVFVIYYKKFKRQINS